MRHCALTTTMMLQRLRTTAAAGGIPFQLRCLRTGGATRGMANTSNLPGHAGSGRTVGMKPRLNLADKYTPKAIEEGWYNYWASRGLFGTTPITATPPNEPKPQINMLLPPPNVTGTLHIGHALMVSIQDSLARWYRMNGHPVRWLPGTDHAGIATQTVVEKHLTLHSRGKLGRKGLIPQIERWKNEYGGLILRQMERMGSSADPRKEYYTLEEGLSNGVKRAFVRLYEEGLIYRSVKMVNWSVKAGTTLSEIELETEEVGPEGIVEGAKFGELHQIAYKVVGDEEREVIVATTRPETLYGDVAIAVHPDDPRYLDLHYKYVQHPILRKVQIPVIPDAELVDPEFGSGAVKITPAHDTNDFAFWKRHSSLASVDAQEANTSSASGPEKKLPLPLKQVFGSDGKMIPGNVDPFVEGLDRLAARKQTVHLLNSNYTYRGVTKHNMRISRCSRTGDVIEPMLLPQWFLKTKPMAEKVLAKGMVPPPPPRGEGGAEEDALDLDLDVGGFSFLPPAKDASKTSSEIAVPETEEKLLIRPFWYRNEWKNWLSGIHDWCLSRQIWWGHRIPAWRVVDPKNPNKHSISSQLSDRDDARWIVALTEEEARAKLSPDEQLFELHQDEDVLDTWFSSGLLPLTTAGWTGETSQPAAEWRQNYPLTFIESGHDILFFWLARMAMLCTWFSNTLPFHEILLHPLVCDATGRKMSKSVGNVLDPLAIIDGRSPQQSLLAHQEQIDAQNKKIKILEQLQKNPETASRTVAHELKTLNEAMKKSRKLKPPRGITESGADPLRITLIDYLRQTRQISFDVHTVDQFRKLAIKLYNLCKFFQNLQLQHSSSSSSSSTSTSPSSITNIISIPPHITSYSSLNLHDAYLLHHLRNTIATCNNAFHTRTLHRAVDALRVFIYDVLANVYIMAIKPDLDNPLTPPNEIHHTLQLTAYAIDTALRLGHPFMPYLTEGLWQTLAPAERQDVDGASILRARYPREEDIPDISQMEIRAFEKVLDITEVLRAAAPAHGFEGGGKVGAGKVGGMTGWVRVVVVGADEETRRASKRYEKQIGKLAKLSDVLRVVTGEEDGMDGEEVREGLRRVGVLSVEHGVGEVRERERVGGREGGVKVVRDEVGEGWWVIYESLL